jgi:hypothetical protein
MEQIRQSLNDPEAVKRLLEEERVQVEHDQKERMSRDQKRRRKAEWLEAQKAHV